MSDRTFALAVGAALCAMFTFVISVHLFGLLPTFITIGWTIITLVVTIAMWCSAKFEIQDMLWRIMEIPKRRERKAQRLAYTQVKEWHNKKAHGVPTRLPNNVHATGNKQLAA
jgi:hypothetical protein